VDRETRFQLFGRKILSLEIPNLSRIEPSRRVTPNDKSRRNPDSRLRPLRCAIWLYERCTFKRAPRLAKQGYAIYHTEYRISTIRIALSVASLLFRVEQSSVADKVWQGISANNAKPVRRPWPANGDARIGGDDERKTRSILPFTVTQRRTETKRLFATLEVHWQPRLSKGGRRLGCLGSRLLAREGIVKDSLDEGFARWGLSAATFDLARPSFWKPS
jgi:hypothetical protein